MKFVLILVLSLPFNNGNFMDLLLPGISNSAREFTQVLAKQPLIQAASRFSGDTIASTLNAFSNLRLSLARSMGGLPGASFPNLFNSSETNNVAFTNKIVAEYNAGLLNEDAKLSITQLLRKYGKPVEEHDVQTSDGYLLTLHRIPSTGAVVFLMHGLLGSADDYIVAGPDKGYAYLLAEAGYDVWMGNARGSKHSRRHIQLDPSEADFWDFSWHEIGYYDLPAMIDYALSKTGHAKLKYIGHSQGTTSFFVMGSERPAYNEKISLMVALSPVAFMGNVRSPVVRMLAPGGPFIHGLATTLGVYEFLPDNPIFRGLRRLMCGFGPLSEILCSNGVFLVVGVDFDQLDVRNLPVLYGHMPSGASMKQFAHYGQGVVSKAFRKFDYGRSENVRRYGTEVPPSYDLSRISAPVSLVYSDADWLAHPADVDELYNKLGNCVDIHKVPHSQFNHIDFLFAKDSRSLIYDRLSKLLTYYQ